MTAPRQPKDHSISALGVIASAMLLVAACFGALEAVGQLVTWWRGGP